MYSAGRKDAETLWMKLLFVLLVSLYTYLSMIEMVPGSKLPVLLTNDYIIGHHLFVVMLFFGGAICELNLSLSCRVT